MKERNEIQEDIVNNLPIPCHGLLNLAPRVGKTKITIDIIKKEKPKRILWVTPNTKLRDEDIPAEFKLWKATTYLKRTDIICYASLSDHVGKYDLIILDEYQNITDNNAQPILNGKILYKNIIGLSGTHPRHREKKTLYERLGLEILVSISIDEAVEKKLIAPYKITLIECELNNVDKNIKAGSKDRPFFTTELAQYRYFTKSIAEKIELGITVPKFYYLNRMRFIYNLKSKNEFAKKFISKLKGRTLVFTGGIPWTEFISPHTYHSKTDDIDLQKFLKKEIDLLACVNAGGVGFTYEGVDNFVIVQVNSDMKGDATQKIARSLVLQDDYIANIYIIYVGDTVETQWITKVISSLNQNNIIQKSHKDYE